MLIQALLLLASTTYAAIPPLPIDFMGRELSSEKDIKFEGRNAQKGSVIVFLSAKCPCSASHEETLKKMSSEFEPNGFRFVGIHSNIDEDWQMSHSHFSATALPFPVIQDNDAKIAIAFGAFKTPHVFVVNPKGEILFQGGVDDSHDAAKAKVPHLKNALIAINNGQVPEVKEARALGCVIKRP